MRTRAIILTFFACVFFISCDVQSGITKKSVEKYETTPTPQSSIEVLPPIDPADVVNADVKVEGPKITINPSTATTTVDCNKYNPVAINGDSKQVTIRGVCRQLMVNGDRNQIIGVAFSEIIINGYGNTIQHSKYVNGKRPFVKDNGTDNSVAKATK